MSSQEQIHITGFSRLLIQKGGDGFSDLDYSGIWISKDRHWLIAPTSGRASYQLLPISQDAGIRIAKDFKISRIIGTLQEIIKAFSKMSMYVTEIDS